MNRPYSGEWRYSVVCAPRGRQAAPPYSPCRASHSSLLRRVAVASFGDLPANVTAQRGMGRSFSLEDEFERQLYQSRVTRLHHLAEGRGCKVT